MVESVVLVHQACAVLTLTCPVCLSAVNIQQLSLVKVQCLRYIACPSLDNLIFTHTLSLEDPVLVIKAVGHVVHKLARVGSEVTVVK